MHLRRDLCLFVSLLLCAQTLDAKSVPPQPNEVAKMARYIIGTSTWASIASIATEHDVKGYPYVAVKSLSDGPPNNRTGVPYFYMTDLDATAVNVAANNKCTIVATLAQSDYCKDNKFDSQDPRCAKVTISGRFVKVNKSSQEYQFGENALFSKHPAMKTWPKEHNFYVAKVAIEHIEVLDFFGGIKHVTIEDYFNANVHVDDIVVRLV